MRLKVTELQNNQHVQMVTGVGWTTGNQLLTTADDKKVLRWNLNGEFVGNVLTTNSHPTFLSWCPRLSGGGQDLFALGCTDGTFQLIGRGGRVEKEVKAHCGAVTSLKWNFEGTALATAGEDGTLKQWSRTGNLRSKLASSDHAIYDTCWSSDNQSVLYCTGKFIIIVDAKPRRISEKQRMWKAHEGTVLKVDWNPINNLIVSGGEDKKYKVWDHYGRQLHSSGVCDFSITSVAWAPSGNVFAAGSFNMLALCDKTGWDHSRTRTNTGSILDIDWTVDGTHLAGGGGNSSVFFAKIVDRSIEWMNFVVNLNEDNQVLVTDVHNPLVIEKIEYADVVIEMSMGYDHLIICTSKRCYIKYLKNLSRTALEFDLKGTVSLISQAQKYFMVVDNQKGIQIYTYDAKLVSNPRIATIQRPEYLKPRHVSLANDYLAVVDRQSNKQIELLDVITGRRLRDREVIRHQLDIIEVGISHAGSLDDCNLFFIDSNQDLYLTQIQSSNPNSIHKLATMVDTAMWNDTLDILAVVCDSNLKIYYYPNVVYVDKGLTEQTSTTTDASNFGKSPRFISFLESTCTIRRSNGAILVTSILSSPSILYKYANDTEWDKCIRLCRFVGEPMMWGVLAAMALNAQDLETAEQALSEIDEVDRLQFIQYIKTIPSLEGRNAELLLYGQRPDEAGNLLIEAGLIFRAIHLNIRIFNWDKALTLATKYRTHVDTVLYFRKKYLTAMQMKETKENFIKYNKQVETDWSSISTKITQEEEKEKENGTPYTPSFNNSSSSNGCYSQQETDLHGFGVVENSNSWRQPDEVNSQSVGGLKSGGVRREGLLLSVQRRQESKGDSKTTNDTNFPAVESTTDNKTVDSDANTNAIDSTPNVGI